MIETTLDGKTKDIVQDNIEQLKQLFPEIVTEDKIDFDKLKEILGKEIDDSNERYDFTWKGKHEAVKISQTPSEGTLRPSKEDSKNWDTTENLYIEGDNLEVLKLLQKSYYGKIKLIYLDPPYNTGNDFVYEDDFTDNLKNYLEQDESGFAVSSNPETSGRYHTNWLNMMFSRLKLARNLLSEEGAIFISIDDNEVNNLRLICDQIFGANNFLSLISVIVKTEGRRYGYFAKTHEYLLVYSKNNEKTILNEIKIEGKNYKYNDEYGGYNLKELRNGNSKAFNSANRPNLRYPFYVDLKTHDQDGFCQLYLEKKDYLTEVLPIIVDGRESVWRWGKEKSIKEKNDLIARVGKDNQVRIFQKTRKLTQTPKTFWQDKQMISNKGTNEVKSILGTNIFDFPKPLSLLNRIIEIGINEDDIVLDFFSGSATTAHALMNFNLNKNIKNKYILVQLPEKIDVESEAYQKGYENICEIGKERIRRAGDKLLEENPNVNIDIGFKVFKLDSSNLTKWNPDVDNLEDSLIIASDNLVDDRSELDLVYEIMLKYGVELTAPVEEISFDNYNFYSVGRGSLVICLNDYVTCDVAEDILKIMKDLSPDIIRVVFKDNGFESDADKTNVKEILRNNDVDEFITI